MRRRAYVAPRVIRDRGWKLEIEGDEMRRGKTGRDVCACCFNETKDDGNKVTRVKIKNTNFIKIHGMYMEYIKCANLHMYITSYK